MCLMHGITPLQLASLRDDPIYRTIYEQEADTLRNRSSLLYLELQLLGPKAMENAKYYVERREDRQNWEVSKFVLEKLLPGPKQTHEVNVNATLNAVSLQFLNEKLPGLKAELDVEVGSLDDDPALTRALPSGNGTGHG
jgi:hypothetical protein